VPPIKSLLVANRGEIALRIVDAAHDMGMRAVAVYAEADRRAPHVRRADLAIALDGDSLSETYLHSGRLIAAAKRADADAVHPGYGFLSENATFARAVIDAGLTWVGPHPDAIARMGDKLAAKALAAEHSIPLLPSARLEGDAPFEWRAQAAGVGYPLLIKAAAGGGGRGMRLVLDEDDLEAAVLAARREAADSFGDGTVFAERFLAAPRHVEIQVVADQHGNVVHLGERECSIQRRHQKLIEEAPSPAVDDLLRDQLGAAAVRLARAIDYDNLGTVEFLLDAERAAFYFLEMNTRLQVEHRVTEAVTGFDLVELQLRAAMGEAFDFEQDEIDLEGHAIEARLVAEDPAAGWLPSTGMLHRFFEGGDFDVRWDVGYFGGMEVSPQYDSLLGKVIATGDTREEATRRLARELLGAAIHGVRTNRDHLVAVLESEDFVAGNTTTAFIDLHLTLLDARPDPVVSNTHLLAAILYAQRARRLADRHWQAAPSGWRNVRSQDQTATFEIHDERVEVSYRVFDDDAFEAAIDDVAVDGRVIEYLPDALWLEVGSAQVQCTVNHCDGVWYVNSSFGQTDVVEIERFDVGSSVSAAGGLVAPVPGRIIAVEVAIGDVVAAGQTLVVMEAMKVEHRVTAPVDGKVTDVLVAVGDNVDAHRVLVQMDAA
jgi:acetyl/propionyl-CoA carboxylase alpha subunit